MLARVKTGARKPKAVLAFTPHVFDCFSWCFYDLPRRGASGLPRQREHGYYIKPRQAGLPIACLGGPKRVKKEGFGAFMCMTGMARVSPPRWRTRVKPAYRRFLPMPSGRSRRFPNQQGVENARRPLVGKPARQQAWKSAVQGGCPAGAGEIFLTWTKSRKGKPLGACLKKITVHKTIVKSGENAIPPAAFFGWHRHC